MIEQITCNQEAAEQTIQNVYQDALEQLKVAANKGISRPILNFWAPSYSAGYKSIDLIKKHGVSVVERGLGSTRKYDGSYNFHVTFEFNN